jgi:hypothetical protein
MIPRNGARRFWKLFWKRALEFEPVKVADDLRESVLEKKLWRDWVHGRVKKRYQDELRNNTLFAELSPAVRRFYELPANETSIPLRIKSTDIEPEPSTSK